MKKQTLIKTFAATAALLTAGISAAGEINVSDVAYTQTAQRKVVITYKLTGTESAVVTIDVCTNGVSIGEQNFTRLSGDVNKVVAPDATAEKRIVWWATKDWPNHRIDSGVTVKVNAWALTNPPDYFVMDLTTGDRKYYASTNALPDGGLANDIYKTTKLVLRRIPAGGETFMMGLSTNDSSISAAYDYYLGRGGMPPHPVSFNNDYYIGVFEMTVRQYATVWPTQYVPDTNPQYFQPDKQPRVWTHTSNIRGVNKYWPRDLHEVQSSPDRFIKLLRGISGGVVEFDLPTEAQWEFACRAGSTTLWYDDVTWEGRGVCPDYMWADSWGKAKGCVQEVGLLKPNAYGLYDMHGNAQEVCLDAWANGTAVTDGSPVVEPIGPEASDGSTYRVAKGGGYTTDKGLCGSGMRTAVSGSGLASDTGLRIACPAVAK